MPLPIKASEYSHCMELLSSLSIGDALNKDCKAEELTRAYPTLRCLEGCKVNIDELDYLAKRLDGFDAVEVSQFQAMAEDIKNLCAPIPSALHAQVRENQEASGKTLGQYMTWLITQFYEYEKGGTPNMADNKRTVAFQVPADLFEQFKAYLEKNHIKQNAFFLDCIQRALADEAE